MKALLCYSKDDFRLEEIPTPEIDETQMLVEMIYTGLCGSDIKKIIDPGYRKPGIYGHELVGRVVKKGKNVKNFDIGDIVVAGHHIPCYKCHYCKRGSHTMCRHFKKTNFYPGSFSQYIRLTDEHINNTVFKLPEGQNLKEAVFVEPVACCIRAMDRIKNRKGDYFVVVGTGSIGLIFLQLAKLGGANIIAIDLDTKRLRLAKELGADYILNPQNSDIVKEIIKISKMGVDNTILTVTNEITLKSAVEYSRDGGVINIFGVAKKGQTIPLDFEAIYSRELSIKSHYSSTPETLKKAYDVVIGKKIKVSPLISKVLDLSNFKKGFDLMLNQQAYKVIFKL
jgi:L-iditol 2-dehydrogenase